MSIMSFFAMQYQILFHDTMAYGSHHYLVNLKFQNIARETILFESRVGGGEDWTDQLKDIVMFTREAYSLNLAPVGLGGKVAILLTYEEPSRSTVRDGVSTSMSPNFSNTGAGGPPFLRGAAARRKRASIRASSSSTPNGFVT